MSQIMEETNTQITWPSKLKIGAKSKKGRQSDRLAGGKWGREGERDRERGEEGGRQREREERGGGGVIEEFFF